MGYTVEDIDPYQRVEAETLAWGQGIEKNHVRREESISVILMTAIMLKLKVSDLAIMAL